MWPDAIVLPELVRRQRRGRAFAMIAMCLGGLTLLFSVFVFFSGLSSEEVGVRGAGLVLGIVSAMIGLSLLGLAVHLWRRLALQFRLGAAILAGTLFDLRDLALRLRCSEARAQDMLEAGRREGWLSFIGHGRSYAGSPSPLQSNAIKRDQSGWTTRGQAGSNR